MKCLNEICGNNYEGDCLKKIEDDCKDFIPEPEPIDAGHRNLTEVKE